VINRVVLVGRLGQDPELRVTGSGISVCNVSLAVSRIRAREGQPDTDWIDVVLWRQSAEFAGNYLRKGYLVGVDGRLQVREWQTQAGDKRKSVEVVADSIQNLQPRDRSGGGAPKADAASRPAAEKPAPARDEEVAEDIRETFGDSGDDFDPFADA